MALKDFKGIGDNLTTEEFNGLVSLLRHFITHKDTIRMADIVKGEYADYEFDITGCTILDTGILVTDETTTAQPKVKLTNPAFHYSTYTLQLEVIHYTDVNILDDTTDDFKVTETLEIELVKDTWVDIPLTDMEDGYIISLDANVKITHDKTEIHGIFGLNTTSEPAIIQTGENAEIYGHLTDYDGSDYNTTGCSGKTVYFYEVLTPTFTLSASKDIIQTSETTDIECRVIDADGSIAKNKKIYFYKKEEN